MPKNPVKFNRGSLDNNLAILGLFVTLCALVSSGFAQYKDWFTVQSSRTPAFSLWHVCYNGDFGNCVDPLSLDQYDYDAALISSRLFLLLAIVLLAFLTLLASASLLGSQKVNGTSPVIFPALCAFVLATQILGNSIFEGSVRIRVTRYLTPYGQPRVDSVFGWAGVSAWVSFVLVIIDTIIYGSYFVFGSRAMNELEHHGDDEE